MIGSEKNIASYSVTCYVFIGIFNQICHVPFFIESLAESVGEACEKSPNSSLLEISKVVGTE